MQRSHPLRAAILALLVLGGIVNFLDRSALSVANTTLRGELHLSATQIGALFSAFSIAYGLAQLPAGWLLDRFGPRPVLGLSMLLWSAAQMATGAVSGFATLAGTRIGLGTGEAPFLPGGVKVIRDWYAEPERGLPMGILNASTTLGQAVAPPVLTLLLLTSGWRSMFLGIGALGVVVALVWWPVYPAKSPQDDGTPFQERASLARDVWGLLRQRTLWGMMLGFSGINYTAWLYLTWVPGYLEAAHQVSLKAAGWLAALPFLMGSAGMLVNGAVADRLVGRGRDPLHSRKGLIVAGMLCSATCTLLVPHAATAWGAAAVIVGTGADRRACTSGSQGGGGTEFRKFSVCLGCTMVDRMASGQDPFIPSRAEDLLGGNVSGSCGLSVPGPRPHPGPQGLSLLKHCPVVVIDRQDLACPVRVRGPAL
jgi:MFS family permease